MSDDQNRGMEKQAKDAQAQAASVQAQLKKQQDAEAQRQLNQTNKSNSIQSEDATRARREAGISDTLLASGNEDDLKNGLTKKLLS